LPGGEIAASRGTDLASADASSLPTASVFKQNTPIFGIIPPVFLSTTSVFAAGGASLSIYAQVFFKSVATLFISAHTLFKSDATLSIGDAALFGENRPFLKKMPVFASPTRQATPFSTICR
jgi:hypothetical protein